MLSLKIFSGNSSVFRLFSSTAATFSDAIIKTDEKPSRDEVWKRRVKFADPVIQRLEKPQSKIYYAPEWILENTPRMDEKYTPLIHNVMTPEKWEYQNKVWYTWIVLLITFKFRLFGRIITLCPRQVSPLTLAFRIINLTNCISGLPKPVEVFHCEESFHFSVRKVWPACEFSWRMKVDDALLQLNFKNNKVCLCCILKYNRRSWEKSHGNQGSRKIEVDFNMCFCLRIQK